MRLALIGCGRRLCESLLPVLAENSKVRVTVLIDPRERALQEASAALRSLGVWLGEETLRLHDDDPLSPSLVDAVVVASPHAYHEKQARRWLERGKPVFIEKPLACHPERAAELVEMSRGVGLSVADPRRFRIDLATVARLVHSGAVGRLRRVCYRDFVEMADDFERNWRNDPRLAGGGVLMDLGCHTFGVLMRICPAQDAEIERVHLRRSPHHVETEARIRLRLGSVIEVEMAIGSVEDSAEAREDLTLWGDSGTIRLFRKRSGMSFSSIELIRGVERRSLCTPLGRHYDGEGLLRFLRHPNRSDGNLHHHLKVLRIITGVYEKASVIAADGPQSLTA